MRQVFNLTNGTDLVGAQLPDGSPIAGVQIDNPSGYWLSIYPSAQYVPPYMMGWALVLAAVPSVDVHFSLVGPSGQVGTAAGDAVIVTLVDGAENVGDTNGTPFIEAFTATPPTVVNATALLSWFGPPLTIVAPVSLVKRVRLLTLDMALAPGPGANDGPVDAGIYQTVNNISTLILSIPLTRDNPTFGRVYAGGLDLPIGGILGYQASARWADRNFNITALTQLI